MPMAMVITVNINNTVKCSELNIENDFREKRLYINYLEYMAQLVGVSHTFTEER